MKRFLLLCLTAGLMLAAGACRGPKAPLETDLYQYEDATDYASFSLFLEYPTARRGAGAAIRADLMEVLDRQLAYMMSYEGERRFPAYAGKPEDTDACLDYYREQGFTLLAQLAEEGNHEMEEAILESDGMSEAEKAQYISDIPGWEYDFTLEKVEDTLRYVVFLSEDYVYWGGAHGGVTGQGFLTYDRKTGARVESIIDPDCTEQIQPLLIKGLLGYFSENGEELTAEEMRGWLFLDEGEPIPLPQWEPSPTRDGISFVYQQYEIAAYALGMPGFIIPYAEIAPFLTPEAKALLGL